MNFFTKNSEAKKREEKPSFWISYADIMAGLLLMFILLLTVVIIDYQDIMGQKTAELELKQQSIEEQQQKIEQMVGVREEIIKALQQEFADTDLRLEIDDKTGSIRIPGEVFFDFDSTEISKEGTENLSRFIPAYVDTILSDNFREYISEIIIEGHTDDLGNYMYNLELSQNRALAVIKEIYADDFVEFKYEKNLRSYLTANGRSYSQPILDENGDIDRDRSRRVEFKFRLKDEEMINEMQEILEG